MKQLSGQRHAELEKLAALLDERVDLSDIPEQQNWDDAERARFYRPVKRSVTMRLDADVLEWFKTNSEKYQSRINQVLREFVIAQRKARSSKT